MDLWYTRTEGNYKVKVPAEGDPIYTIGMYVCCTLLCILQQASENIHSIRALLKSAKR